MTGAPPVDAVLEAEASISIARLHGEACIRCGAVFLPLFPVGSIYTRDRDGALRAWHVVACGQHRDDRS